MVGAVDVGSDLELAVCGSRSPAVWSCESEGLAQRPYWSALGASNDGQAFALDGCTASHRYVPFPRETWLAVADLSGGTVARNGDGAWPELGLAFGVVWLRHEHVRHVRQVSCGAFAAVFCLPRIRALRVPWLCMSRRRSLSSECSLAVAGVGRLALSTHAGCAGATRLEILRVQICRLVSSSSGPGRRTPLPGSGAAGSSLMVVRPAWQCGMGAMPSTLRMSRLFLRLGTFANGPATAFVLEDVHRGSRLMALGALPVRGGPHSPSLRAVAAVVWIRCRIGGGQGRI